jgi:hypothetical protein
VALYLNVFVISRFGEPIAEMRLPTLRQCRNLQRPPHGYDIVAPERLRDVQACDVGNAHAVRIATGERDGISSPHVALVLHGEVETGPAAGKKSADHVGGLKSDPEFVARDRRHSRDEQASRSTHELVAAALPGVPVA